MFDTVTVQPHEPIAMLTSKESAYRALNQLCSVTAGRMFARDTDSLKDDPASRVQRCIELTLSEVQKAASKVGTDPNADRMMSQANRKLDSLQSLALLSRIIQKEVIWDDE